MKATTAALALLSATVSMAAPTTMTPRFTPTGYVVPKLIKSHDIQTNLNAVDIQTSTVRNGNTETSTLYDIPIPQALGGKTCALVFRAGQIGSGDVVEGEQAMDIFRNNFEDLSTLQYGNLRDQELARIRFDATSGYYVFDVVDVVPKIDNFPCPAGRTLHWESVAVGTYDVNIVQQEFSQDGTYSGSGIPNGLSIAWW